MSKLFVFGDSYCTPNCCVKPEDSFWGLLAKDLGNNISAIENWSWPGNNIDSISHNIVSSINYFEPNDYLLIGIPPAGRLTMFNPAEEIWPKKTIYNNRLIEQDTVDILCH